MRRRSRGRRAEAGAQPLPVALSGTPGTGKSSVARMLPAALRVVEVGDLARRLGCARGRGRNVEVDLRALARRLARADAPAVDVVVGHLAHLLPVDRVILLRCHPRELHERLRRARRGTPRERADNVTAEAIDLLGAEARGLGRRVVEVDTTGRPPTAVAREVRRRLGPRPGPPPRPPDWIREAGVTDYLLRLRP